MSLIQAGSIQISYDTFGEGEPLLLIMGFGAPGGAWLPTLPFLGGFNCIYFDNRGTGNSDKPEGIYTVPEMAEDASNLLKALGIPKAKIYGVSMGGMIAQELAVRHPEQVIKAVFGCTTPGGPKAFRASEETIQKLVEGATLLASNPEAGIDLMTPLLFPPAVLAAHPEIKPLTLAALKMLPPTPPESIRRTLAGIMQFDVYDRLGQISCPVLIVHGDADVLVPPGNAALIKERIPHAEVFMIPGAGHSYAINDLAGINGRIANWLAA